MTSSRYGMVGWREFASNRANILRKYDAAKEVSASRPIKTEHGVTGEAAIREWLTSFLPKKYGVTSGSIIPDVLESPGYKLYYHDIIIFDALNAPVLWTDDNPDQSQQGRKRALPARYVYSVIETKASFGADPARDAIDKLRQLNEIAAHFPPQFSCAAIFMELPISLASQGNLLRHLLPNPMVQGFWGGMIMRCTLNNDMSGLIKIFRGDGSPGSAQNDRTIPLAKDIDALEIFMTKDGACSIPPAAGAMFVSDGVSNWMVSKLFMPSFCINDLCVGLMWSANGFSQFALHLLSYLEGVDPQNRKYRFGQIFDRLEQRE
jgi:hypothetical protein